MYVNSGKCVHMLGLLCTLAYLYFRSKIPFLFLFHHPWTWRAIYLIEFSVAFLLLPHNSTGSLYSLSFLQSSDYPAVDPITLNIIFSWDFLLDYLSILHSGSQAHTADSRNCHLATLHGFSTLGFVPRLLTSRPFVLAFLPLRSFISPSSPT